MIGIPTAIVDSSWIDIDAGLVKLGICRMPPGFWAKAGTVQVRPASSQPAAAHRHNLAINSASLPCRPLYFAPIDHQASVAHCLSVEPDVFHPPTVEGAVDH